MAEPTFTGPFRKEMENFISLKRSVGYKYNTEPGILKRFDSYLAAKYPEGSGKGWTSPAYLRSLSVMDSGIGTRRLLWFFESRTVSIP